MDDVLGEVLVHFGPDLGPNSIFSGGHTFIRVKGKKLIFLFF
jgi:hypothetical protein